MAAVLSTMVSPLRNMVNGQAIGTMASSFFEIFGQK
jgi:hypothetical protein